MVDTELLLLTGGTLGIAFIILYFLIDVKKNQFKTMRYQVQLTDLMKMKDIVLKDNPKQQVSTVSEVSKMETPETPETQEKPKEETKDAIKQAIINLLDKL